MATFTIDSDNNITGYGPGEAIPDGNTEQFTTENELTELAAQWPASRLVELWNSIPGLTGVRKFTSRKTAVARLWKAIQSLVSSPDVAPKAERSGKRASRKSKAHTARDGSKKADIIRLLERAKGVTLAELMTATGWQAHSVRGFISGTLGNVSGAIKGSHLRRDRWEPWPVPLLARHTTAPARINREEAAPAPSFVPAIPVNPQPTLPRRLHELEQWRR